MTPKLTDKDWVEIYYALDSKLQWVEETQNDLEGRQWQRHLNDILLKIGLDGQNMREEGKKESKMVKMAAEKSQASYTHKQWMDRHRPVVPCSAYHMTIGGICLNCGYDPAETARLVTFQRRNWRR